MTTNPALGLEAAADGLLVRLIEEMRRMAGKYADLPQHEAATLLACDLAGLEVHRLASALANVIISETRRSELPPMVTTDDITGTGDATDTGDAGFDPRYAGVHIRLIGPEDACRRVLDDVGAGPVKLTGLRGPHKPEQVEHAGEVRFYVNTDPKTVKLTRSRARTARRNRTNTED